MSKPTLHLRWVDREVLVQYPHRVESRVSRVLQQFHVHPDGPDFVVETVDGITQPVYGTWTDVPLITEDT